MAETEVIVATDRWKTLKRVLPEDVYLAIKGFEKAVGEQIGGHKHFIQTTQEGSLQIGCEVHTFEEWEEKAELLGKENGYSAMDVEIYKLHIALLAKVSKLLWAKKEK